MPRENLQHLFCTDIPHHRPALLVSASDKSPRLHLSSVSVFISVVLVVVVVNASCLVSAEAGVDAVLLIHVSLVRLDHSSFDVIP